MINTAVARPATIVLQRSFGPRALRAAGRLAGSRRPEPRSSQVRLVQNGGHANGDDLPLLRDSPSALIISVRRTTRTVVRVMSWISCMLSSTYTVE